MPVTPTGSLSKPLTALEALWVASATWQSWAGASYADHVHLVTLPDPPANGQHYDADELAALRPFVLLDVAPDGQGHDTQRIGELHYRHGGRLTAHVEADVPEAYEGSPRDAKIDFLNKLGGVLDDMLALAGTSSGGIGYLYVRSFDLVEGPWRVEPDAAAGMGDHFYAMLHIAWGV